MFEKYIEKKTIMLKNSSLPTLHTQHYSNQQQIVKSQPDIWYHILGG